MKKKKKKQKLNKLRNEYFAAVSRSDGMTWTRGLASLNDAIKFYDSDYNSGNCIAWIKGDLSNLDGKVTFGAGAIIGSIFSFGISALGVGAHKTDALGTLKKWLFERVEQLNEEFDVD